jgi:hypothetical protein
MVVNEASGDVHPVVAGAHEVGGPLALRLSRPGGPDATGHFAAAAAVVTGEGDAVDFSSGADSGALLDDLPAEARVVLLHMFVELVAVGASERRVRIRAGGVGGHGEGSVVAECFFRCVLYWGRDCAIPVGRRETSTSSCVVAMQVVKMKDGVELELVDETG